ncbi:response regulator [Sphingomonas turrisvirgatae]|nr:response regulator [Sphingomonas turrisvirgatae]
MTQPSLNRILIVEDEMIVRLIGSDTLTDAGYDVVEAGSADEALRILERHGDVEVLFTDIRMPGTMDGLELARVVHERWPAMKILITSGDTFPPRSAIADDGRFLPKPYSTEVLRREIDTLLTL